MLITNRYKDEDILNPNERTSALIFSLFIWLIFHIKQRTSCIRCVYLFSVAQVNITSGHSNDLGEFQWNQVAETMVISASFYGMYCWVSSQQSHQKESIDTLGSITVAPGRRNCWNVVFCKTSPVTKENTTAHRYSILARGILKEYKCVVRVEILILKQVTKCFT